MSAFYDRMADTALRLISQYGQAVTIRETGEGSYDPVTGFDTPGGTTEQIAQGILLDYTGREFAENSLLIHGDKKLKIAAKGMTGAPNLLAEVVIQGETWSIVPPLKEINPAGTPLLYELQVRK